VHQIDRVDWDRPRLVSRYAAAALEVEAGCFVEGAAKGIYRTEDAASALIGERRFAGRVLSASQYRNGHERARIRSPALPAYSALPVDSLAEGKRGKSGNGDGTHDQTLVS
jgi:hypothetical protein